MAGFLNAFNQAYRSPDDPQEVDANEQRRYAKMAQEDLSNTKGVRYDFNTESIVGDINSANEVDRRRLLMGTKVPSVAADGSIVEFDVSNVMQEEDGSWVVGLKNPQTGEDTIVTDTSNADPNGRVTKFTTEQINNAIANKYKSLATLSGGLDTIIIQQIGARGVTLAGDNRQKQVQQATAKAIEDGNTINTAIEVAEKQGDVDATRGAIGATPGQLKDYLRNSMTPNASMTPGAGDQSANSLFPEREGVQAQLQQQRDAGTAPASTTLLEDSEDALKLPMIDSTDTSGGAKFLRGQRDPEAAKIPLDIGKYSPNVMRPAKFNEDFPELAGTKYVEGLRIGKDGVNAAKGVTYIRGLDRNGVPVDLEKNSFVKDNWDVIGRNADRLQDRDAKLGLPPGTTLLSIQSFADQNQRGAEAAEEQISLFSTKNDPKKLERDRLLNPQTAVDQAVLAGASLEDINSLATKNKTRQNLIDPTNFNSLEKIQKDTGKVTTAISDNAAATVLNPDGSVNQQAAEDIIDKGRKVAEAGGYNSPKAVARTPRNFANDIKVQRALTAAAMAASLQTDSDGTVSFNSTLYNTLFDSNWNTYTTGDPNISLDTLSLMRSRTTGGKSAADRYKDYVTSIDNALETVDAEIDKGRGAIGQLQTVEKRGLFGLITRITQDNEVLSKETVKAIADLGVSAAKGLEELTRLDELIESGNYDGFVDPRQRGAIKRAQEQKVVHILTAGALSKRTGGLAGWVATWGEAAGGINPFTNLDNFKVITGPDGNITDATTLVVVNSLGDEIGEAINLKQLKNAVNTENAERVLSVLLKRQQAQQRQRTQQT